MNPQLEIARSPRACTLKFQSTIRRYQESLLQASSIRRVSTRRKRTGERVRRNNLPEIRLVAFGDWIHSYLSPRQSVDCNPSPPPSPPPLLPPPFRSSPATPIYRFPLPAFPRDEENAKLRSLMGILNTDALSSASIFPPPAFTFLLLPTRIPFLSRSYRSFFSLSNFPSFDRWNSGMPIYRVPGTMRLQLDLFDIASFCHLLPYPLHNVRKSRTVVRCS